MSWILFINTDMSWILFINTDMSWIFIDSDRTPIRISTGRTPISVNTDIMIPKSIRVDILRYLFLLIRLHFISMNIFWIFIDADRTPNSISTNMPPNLSTLICLQIYQLDMSWNIYSN